MNTDVRTVLVIHLPSDWPGTNYQCGYLALAETLPEHVGILCVNRPIDCVVTLLKSPGKFWRGIWSTSVAFESSRLGIVTPRILLHEILARKVPGVTRLNGLLIGRQLRRAIQGVFPLTRQIIQWIYHPNQGWIFGALPEAGKVYHCFDEYMYGEEGTYYPERWEREIPVLRAAEVTFVTSPIQMPRRRPFAQRIHVLPNGIPGFFLETPEARVDPLDRIPKPRILYLGQMYKYLDYPLLEEVFARHPDWQFVMIGRPRKLAGVRNLSKLTNVHLVGPRPHETLPGILSRFQVALMPYKPNPYILPADPLKLYAYLSAGIPIVATDLPGLRSKESLIRLVADEPKAFENAIAAVLAEDQSELRSRMRAEAKLYTWTRISEDHILPVLRDAFGLQPHRECAQRPSRR